MINVVRGLTEVSTRRRSSSCGRMRPARRGAAQAAPAERAAVLLHGPEGRHDAEPHRGDRGRVLRRLQPGPGPGHRPELQSPAVRHHLGGHPGHGRRRASPSTCSSSRSSGWSSRGTPHCGSWSRSTVRSSSCAGAGSRRPTMPAPALPAGGRGGSSIVRSRLSLVGSPWSRSYCSACSCERRSRRAAAAAYEGQRPAPVGAPGPVRRRDRRRPARATTPRRVSTSTLLPGGPNVANVTVGSAPNGPEFTLAWVPKALAGGRDGPVGPCDIAQVFQRSGTLSVSWKDNNITSPEQFKGKKVGVWDFGNEYEVTAGRQEARPRGRQGLHQGHPGLQHERAAG